MDNPKKRVLIVDDSAVVRQTLKSILSSDPALEILDAANDPFQAAAVISREIPDVITLDIEMPRMDGLTFLRKIMSQRPIPVVICSSLAQEGSKSAMEALHLGAVDIMEKPRLGAKEYLEESKIRVCDIVRGAANANLNNADASLSAAATPQVNAPSPSHSRDPKSKAMLETSDKIIAIGASTGGTQALREICSTLPDNCPGVLVAQHMPPGFTSSFVRSLNDSCEVEVKEAQDGDAVMNGMVLFAPGNKHMLLQRDGAVFKVVVRDGELVCRHRPSIEVLFRSVASYAGSNAVGVIMTGMGEDGVKGLKEMRDAGAQTIAQDEATSVVYGMARDAVELGAVVKSLPLGEITDAAVNAAASAAVVKMQR